MKEYILYTNIIRKNENQSFVKAAQELLALLKSDLPTMKNVPEDRGCDKIAFDIDSFHFNNAKILALANKEKRDILTIEDSSFLSLSLTKKKLNSSIEMKNEINSKLQKEGLEVNLETQIVPLIKFLNENISKNDIKKSYADFNTALYLGSFACDLEQFFDTSLYEESLKLIDINSINYDSSDSSCGYEISGINKELSYKLAGNLLLDMFDNAADFVLVNDVRSFMIMDNEQKKIEKEVGRDINLPILNISQLFLAALGESDIKKFGFEYHKIKLNFD